MKPDVDDYLYNIVDLSDSLIMLSMALADKKIGDTRDIGCPGIHGVATSIRREAEAAIELYAKRNCKIDSSTS